MNASLDCPICMEAYEDDDAHYPIVLNCGHSFCFSCTSGYPGKAGQCPFCKVNFNYPNGFIKSYATIECLNLMKQFKSQQRPSSQSDAVQELLERVNKIESSNRSKDECFNKISAMEEEIRRLKLNQNGQSSSTAKPCTSTMISSKEAPEKKTLYSQAPAIEKAATSTSNVISANNEKIKLKQATIDRGNDGNVVIHVNGTIDPSVLMTNSPRRTAPERPERPELLLLRDLLMGFSSNSLERRLLSQGQENSFEPFYGSWKFDKHIRYGKELPMDPQFFNSYVFSKCPEGMQVSAESGLNEQSHWVFTTNLHHRMKLRRQGIEVYHVAFTSPNTFEWGDRKWCVSGNTLTRTIAPDVWAFIKSAS